MPEAGRLWAFRVWLRRSNLDPPTLAQMHPVILHISIIIKSRKCSTISCFWHHHYRHFDFQCKALLSFPKCLESCIFSEVHWSQSQVLSMWYVLNHCIGKQFFREPKPMVRKFFFNIYEIWKVDRWPTNIANWNRQITGRTQANMHDWLFCFWTSLSLRLFNFYETQRHS